MRKWFNRNYTQVLENLLKFWTVKNFLEKLWENFAEIMWKVNEILLKILVNYKEQIFYKFIKLWRKLGEIRDKQYKLMKIWDLLMIR